MGKRRVVEGTTVDRVMTLIQHIKHNKLSLTGL